MSGKFVVQMARLFVGLILGGGLGVMVADAAVTTEEIQKSIIDTGVQGKYCVRCHGSGETVKLDTLEFIDVQSLKICEVVLSKDKATMRSLGGFNSWTLETRNLLMEWCKENGWREDDPASLSEPVLSGSFAPDAANSENHSSAMILDLNERIGQIYHNNCSVCHAPSDPWMHPAYFCQTVYNRSMPWGYFKLIDEWTSDEQEDFAQWCRFNNPKEDYQRFQIPQ